MLKEPNEKQKNLILKAGLNPEMWKVIWDDKDVLEVVNRRGRRHIIKKKYAKNVKMCCNYV